MFSTGLKLIGVDDFITPSKECTKPIFDKNNNSNNIINKINTTLNDCLSCSGCVTSSEVVFIEQQGLDQFMQFVNDNKSKVIIFSLSPQSITSICYKFSLNQTECINKISTFLHEIFNAQYVFECSYANEIVLHASYEEFKDTFVNKTNDKPVLISGICPGLVCYIEKIQGDLLLSYLSKVRSPQAIMGNYIKGLFCDKNNINPNDIFHVSIMPCFDRKLEAFRPDFILDNNIREVDHVLSTFEFEQLLNNYSFQINTNFGFNSIFDNTIQTTMPVSIGNGSGGMSVYIFIKICKELYDLNVKYCDNKWIIDDDKYIVYENINIRNTDYLEWSLRLKDQTYNLVTFACIYGFKNIQNFVYKFKKYNPNTFPHYIEIMACPSKGCLNGGGQISPEMRKELDTNEIKKHIEFLENIYNSFPKYIDENSRNIKFINEIIEKKSVKLYRNFYKLDSKNKDSFDW